MPTSGPGVRRQVLCESESKDGRWPLTTRTHPQPPSRSRSPAFVSPLSFVPCPEGAEASRLRPDSAPSHRTFAQHRLGSSGLRGVVCRAVVDGGVPVVSAPSFLPCVVGVFALQCSAACTGAVVGAALCCLVRLPTPSPPPFTPPFLHLSHTHYYPQADPHLTQRRLNEPGNTHETSPYSTLYPTSPRHARVAFPRLTPKHGQRQQRF